MTENLKSIRLCFILKSQHRREEDASLEMKEAYKIAIDWRLKAKWMKESDCLEINNQLNGEVFIFEEFDGDIFQKFVELHKNSRVIGPKCLLTCCTYQIPIPDTLYPVYCMAMHGLTISGSNIVTENKKNIERMVGFMGGNYSNILTTATTHLVVDSAISEKYFKAYEEGISVMKSDWVEHVWKKSIVGDIKATDEDILSNHKCPIFYNLRITASILDENEKAVLRMKINQNGGTYTQEMTKANHILIIPHGHGSGQKFKYAERWKIKCIKPAWVEECLKKGFSVRYNEYLIQSDGRKYSTPRKNPINGMVSWVDINDSEISVIPSGPSKSVIGDSAVLDTQSGNCSTKDRPIQNIFKTPVKNCRPEASVKRIENDLAYKQVLSDIILTDVKKCGSLLDGCKVFLMGFNANEEEKLRRILNYSGAMRFTELNESVTHIIIGKPDKYELQNISNFPIKPHIVTLQWLDVSIKKGSLEKETNYLYSSQDNIENASNSGITLQPSPLSKKGLQMLNQVKSASPDPNPSIITDQNLINIYSNLQNPASKEVEQKIGTSNSLGNQGCESNDASHQTSVNEKLFSGLSFSIQGHNPTSTEDIRRTIIEFGGFVVTTGSRALVDYTIVPVTNMLKNVGNNEVTSIWIEECLNENRIVVPKYYHRPITVLDFSNRNPFRDCVITFSSYSMCERQFLENIASFMGANCQDVLSKKENAERGVARTTHLVCAVTQGVKYNAAKKWNLPIVNQEWLLDSFYQRKLLPIDPYLLYNYKGFQNIVKLTIESNQLSSSSTKIGDNDVAAKVNRNAGVPRSDNANELLPYLSTSNHSSNVTFDSLRKCSSSNGSNKASNTKIPVLASPLTEAVRRFSSKVLSTEPSYKGAAVTKTKDLPTGFLAKINIEASSSVKRKSESQRSPIEAVRTENPKHKLLRLDDGNVTSSYEEVGWQDTLTDISHTNRENDLDLNPINKRNSQERLAVCHQNDEISSSDGNQDHNAVAATNKKNCENVEDISEKEMKESHRHCIRTLSRNYQKSWNFMISVSNNERKQQCEKIITALGGRIFPTYQIDCLEADRVSHLITDELKKTEKLLCSIASGLWILHSSYLTQCQKSGKFVNEERFEWGNPLSENLHVQNSKDYSSIAKSAHRWRRIIQTEGPLRKPFIGMKAVLITSASDESVQSLVRVVMSGGGVHLQPSDILKSNHVLVKSIKNLDNLPVKLQDIAKRKIHCLPAVYLSDFLMNDPPPKPETCYFDEYKRLL